MICFNLLIEDSEDASTIRNLYLRICFRKDSLMKLTISAQDKPAQKVFDYQLDLDPDTILKMTALICGTVAAV